MRTRVAAISCLLALASFSTVHAQWQPDGIAVCTAVDIQGSAMAVPDGAGGAYIVWADLRNGPGDIYAQRLDAAGHTLWTSDGVAVCTQANDQSAPSLLLDDTGGVIIVWHDWRNQVTSNQDLYAQRLNGAGTPQWAANGVAVTNATAGQHYPLLVSDGAGGAVVAWYDARPGLTVDVYGARLTAAGTLPDGPNGIAISTAASDQTLSSMIPYGSGGAIVAWTDARNGIFDIYAARLDGSGIVLDPTGIPICVGNGEQLYPATVTDGAGGAIIAFSDRGRAGEVYAQRINSAGLVQWAVNGVAVGANLVSLVAQLPPIVSDGAGGAIVAWYRYDLSDRNVYAQRINSSGVEQWLPNDIPVCTAASDQSHLVMTSDNAGGTVVAWTDSRPGGFGSDVYAQRVSPSGAPLWTLNGAIVCSAVGNQSELAIANDMAGGAIFAWRSPISPFESDIYAHRLAGAGQMPTAVSDTRTVARLGQNHPNPFNPETSIPFSLSDGGRVTLRIYDINGRLVATLLDENRKAGEHTVRWNGRNDVGAVAPTGIYFARLESNGVTETRKLVLLK